MSIRRPVRARPRAVVDAAAVTGALAAAHHVLMIGSRLWSWPSVVAPSICRNALKSSAAAALDEWADQRNGRSPNTTHAGA
jgi:hypothetical protein